MLWQVLMSSNVAMDDCLTKNRLCVVRCALCVVRCALDRNSTDEHHNQNDQQYISSGHGHDDFLDISAQSNAAHR